jgi:autotransporter-associated beta strand protein
MKMILGTNKDKVQEAPSMGSWLCRKYLLCGLLASLLAAGAAQGATYTWSGGSGNNNNWSTHQNWQGQGQSSVPSNDGTADLIFQGTTRLSPFADAAWGLNSITFSANAGAFTIGGAQLTLRSGVTNQSTLTQTIQNNIILSQAQTWNALAGNLSFSGAINNNGNLLTIAGGFNTTTTINGPISGSGGLTKNGLGTLTLSGANTFTGGLTLNAGTLALGGNERIHNSVALNMNGGTLNPNNYSETLGALNLWDNSTITLNPGGNQASLTFSSANYTSGILTINGWSGEAHNPGTDDRIFFASLPPIAFLDNVHFAGHPQGARWLPVGDSALYEMVPVPEPSSLVLSLLGIFGFMIWARRRKA